MKKCTVLAFTFACLISAPRISSQNVTSCSNLTIGHSNISNHVGGVGEIIQGECNSGYVIFGSLDGNSTVFSSQCLQNGTWSYTIDCMRAEIRCGPPLNLTGVEVDYARSDSTQTNGSEIFYVCSKGYSVLQGTDKVICHANGSWSKPPICHLDCPPLVAPENGSLSTEAFTFGTVANVSCDLGYYPLNNSPISCGVNGSWNDTVLYCYLTSCGAPPTRTGLAIDAEASDSSRNYGSYVIYKCDLGYDVLQGPNNVTCQSNGTWSSLPVCHKNCHVLPQPQNGALSATNISINTSVRIECFPGFKLINRHGIHCGKNGSWNGTLGDCMEIPRQRNCPELRDISNGKLREYGCCLVKYTCSEGFHLEGDSSRECTDGGEWLPKEPPICKEDESHKFTPKVFVDTKLWKGHYVYRGASFDFTFRVSKVDPVFFGNITGELRDKISIIMLNGSFYPPDRIKMRLARKSGEPRFDQEDLVMEGSLDLVDEEWHCQGKIVSAGFGQFYMVPETSDRTIELPEHIFQTSQEGITPEAAKPQKSKKTIAIVLPILFVLSAIAVFITLFLMYRDGRRGCFGKRNQGLARFHNPTFDPQTLGYA